MFHFFYGGPLSQWYPASFVIDDIEYNCAEQYMMAKKAITFDIDKLSLIMESKDPRQQKQFGRLVDNFDVTTWNTICRKHVYDGNFAKFTQNIDLREFLLSTDDKELVEASPTDKIWGIGLGMNHPDRFDRSKWRGTNWLGEELMNVRESINQISMAEDLRER